MTPEELDRVAGQAAAAAAGAKSAAELRQAVATAADKLAKGDTPWARGTNAHLILNRALKKVNDSCSFQHKGEISYFDGIVVRYGTKGSIRVDILVGDPWKPEKICEFKTGKDENGLSPGRIALIRKHLPEGYKHIPVSELRPNP